MASGRRNKAPRKVGHGRGVPLRMLRAIARKYDLSQIICWTYDLQKRQRILWWAMGGAANAIASSKFAEGIARTLGWNIGDGAFDSSQIRNMKQRIKDLERDMARIFEREGDPREIARRALKLPSDIDD